MKKIELLNNETFSIKGVYGETYVFDGEDLFVQGPIVKKAVVLKSLRTQKGAEDWVRLAGKKYDNVKIMSTSTLKAFDGSVVKADEDEEKPFDSPLPFHVVSTESEEMEIPSGEEEEEEEESEGMEMGESDEVEMEEMDPEDIQEDEMQEQEMFVTQAAQVLHDSQKLHELITSGKHLEPWMQSKLVKVAEYMNALTENLEHRGGEIPGMEGSEKAYGMMKSDDPEEKESEAAKEKEVPAFLKKNDGDKEESEESDKGKEVTKGRGGVTLLKKSEDVDAEKEDEEKTENEGEEKDIKGRIFKSLHAARQWNRFENPNKDRYYIDILREKDMVNETRKSFTKSTGLNAKYIVRDREDDEKFEPKGAFGNKLKKS